ncbi:MULTISPECIES: MBL fold metallo-hydrolase [Oleiagrimonas]|jgi:metallo-beta-lactamase family protein|uniref:MBL fold metallo-hydrolase n=1 Tax=Oleiagrimonas citrea TaxID=1665687 RepID=A0A846ZNJ7_9GAMM|nr:MULTISPECIES: MBL fold metallo-hydrolase [Oleiagrimonas]NKZ39041.1 MBL fold metallo-hydrolase [Oleiagrimonas citrea]RAP57653.1 MBL fold metallo-hydrolase [Oleiagrimonas sp. MCCC 1A03011]
MIRLSSHGAAKQVTGSCHLIESDRARVLVDCGMFQGGRELEEENAEPFAFDASQIDAVVLTHAHLDHCGRLPLLRKRGFRGRVYATDATRDLTRLLLMDSAGLQEEDTRRARRRASRSGEKVSEPLYGLADALRTMDLFARPVAYGETREVAPGMRATFVDAGHILGSSSVQLEIEEEGKRVRVLFSGDIGNPGRPLLNDPAPPPEPPDYVVMETTYGDRDHRPWQASVDELVEAVSSAYQRGGNVLIPTFALERSQEILYVLFHAIEEGRLPRRLPVFLDSPMAISATQIFMEHPEALRTEFAEELSRIDPLDLGGLHMTRETAESMAINRIRGGAVIMAGSGMCTGGRIRHHIRHNIWNENSSMIFVGYAASGTLARRIIDGAGRIRLFGDDIVVRAKIHTINGFSAHAGQSALLDWLQRCGKPKNVFLVHGDYDRGMQAFAAQLDRIGQPWHMSGMGEPILLDAS